MEKQCYFCKSNIIYIDFKNTDLLKKYLTASYKIKNKTKSKCCTKHQHLLASAIKRARYLGLIPYTNLHK